MMPLRGSPKVVGLDLEAEDIKVAYGWFRLHAPLSFSSFILILTTKNRWSVVLSL